MTKKMKSKGLGLVIAGCLLIVAPLVIENVYRATGPDYQYMYQVHSHMLNAYYANTPELMIVQLEQCVEGMRELGLDESMYGAWLPWELTPDKRMDYQYVHLENIIERAYAVIQWRNEAYSGNATTAETLGDVYEMKMDNLRYFLVEGGWSDWIAYDAFLVNNYFWFVIYGTFVSAVLFFVGVVFVVFGIYKFGVSKEWWMAFNDE